MLMRILQLHLYLNLIQLHMLLLLAEVMEVVIGVEVEVLVERELEGRCTGRTRGGQLVHFDGHRALIGRLVDVEVTEATPWSLQARQANALTLSVL